MVSWTGLREHFLSLSFFVWDPFFCLILSLYVWIKSTSILPKKEAFVYLAIFLENLLLKARLAFSMSLRETLSAVFMVS